MSQYTAKILWKRNGDFFGNTYSRGHSWIFDGGAEIEASSSPQVVPVPCSIESHVDPEEAFVASLSSCHMLWFLAIASKKKLLVEQYMDEAVGFMEKDAENKMAFTRVILMPTIIFAGQARPSRELLKKIHDQAHENCFIANSVKTEVETRVL
ncbi:MAG: OsmC family protein [SAR324 cluster bacterium]|nr:OsmC family protein [SAR324 cluster bacterium]